MPPRKSDPPKFKSTWTKRGLFNSCSNSLETSNLVFVLKTICFFFGGGAVFFRVCYIRSFFCGGGSKITFIEFNKMMAKPVLPVQTLVYIHPTQKMFDVTHDLVSAFKSKKQL